MSNVQNTEKKALEKEVKFIIEAYFPEKTTSEEVRKNARNACENVLKETLSYAQQKAFKLVTK